MPVPPVGPYCSDVGIVLVLVLVKTAPLPCFGHLDARKHRTCHALATQALEGAARGPARCPRGARMGRSSPHLVPPKRSKGLHHPPLDAPRALEGAARAAAQCPEGALRGCSSPRSLPRGRSQGLRKPARCPRRLQVGAQASSRYPPCVQSAISTTCLVLQRGARATSCVT